jgi:hypothetical protein
LRCSETKMSSISIAASQTHKTVRATVAALIRQTLSIIAHPGDTLELRIPNIQGKRTDSGYFNDFDKLAQCAAGYDGRAEGIYITLNPVQHCLLARSNNRIKEYAKQTTADKEVARRRWIFVDFDPLRPAGISSSEGENAKALERAKLCRERLAQRGISSLLANSGNGAHLLIPVDLSNDAESTALVKDFLTLLDSRFSDAEVKVDTGMVGANHLIKLYGTLACKGDSISERPHRRSEILEMPESLVPVSVETIQNLIASASMPVSKQVATPTTQTPPCATHTDRSGVDVIRERFNMVAYAERLLGVQAIHQGHEYRLPGNGGFLINPSKGVWYHHSGQEGGDALDLVGHSLFGMSWNKRDPAMFKQVIQEAADFAGVTLPIPRQTTNTQPSATSLSVEKSPIAFTTLQATPAATPAHQKAAVDLLMHVDELDALPPIRWLIQDYVPEDSLVEVYGAPSAGKTQVVFDMAQTLAAAGKPVIYVVAEGLRGYRSRKKAWQQFRKQLGGELYIWREPVQLFEVPAVQHFIDVIKPKQPVLVVFDTLSRCSLGADENNQKDMGFVLEALDKVRRETSATVIAVHHTNATGGRERGSTVIRGGMTVMLEVSKEDDLIAVSCAKVKDSSEFAALYLKPVLVDIGEEAPVPVLIPAEKRIQTSTDKLSSLQLEILRAVGMEMFAVSGIKSNQLDELLPPSTKRASKYYSLNNLIRLGYVAPHEKGDPYKITETGRLKLSNAENAVVSIKSNMSKASPSPFIWTLPEPCPMSSPIPHTYRCGMDRTLDFEAKFRQING